MLQSPVLRSLLTYPPVHRNAKAKKLLIQIDRCHIHRRRAVVGSSTAQNVASRVAVYGHVCFYVGPLPYHECTRYKALNSIILMNCLRVRKCPRISEHGFEPRGPFRARPTSLS